MAKKDASFSDSVVKKTTVNSDLAPIPSGKKWKLVEITICDINTGDNQSSTFEILFGSGVTFESIRLLSITGNTYVFPLNMDLDGNGVKFIRITRTNNSNTDKRLPFYLKAFEK